MGIAREVADRATAALEANDLEAVRACYAEDAVAVTPDSGELRGRDAVVRWLSVWGEAFPDGGYESSAQYEDGNVAIDEGYLTGVHTGPLRTPSGDSIPPTGRSVRVRSCDIAVVEGGVITRHHFYFDSEDFTRQLGLDG
ncbi:ester cyclase [Naasia sp. SYSU D00057]|uniref:ester cyclase n=1 Tax=Naasia sp. SYSU D00057 TaxID=2817380 RepID=UPI001B306B06|nr:nuclear transport factor 2 family protein [Naasia sp. SYSU D00057]